MFTMYIDITTTIYRRKNKATFMDVRFLYSIWMVKVDCEKLSIYIYIAIPCASLSTNIQRHIVKNEWVNKYIY